MNQFDLSDFPDLPDTTSLTDFVDPTVSFAADSAPLQKAPEPVRRDVPPALVPRVLAKLIDGAAAGVLYTLCTALVADWLVGFLLGGVAAAAYLLTADGLDLSSMPRRSYGKKVMGLFPSRLDGEPMDVGASARRNWMFVPLYFVQAFTFAAPALSVLILLVALGLIAYEVYWVVVSPGGVRWGDDLAGTEVLRTVTVQREGMGMNSVERMGGMEDLGSEKTGLP